MSYKYIIGVDPSLRDTGVAVLDNMACLQKTFSVQTKSGLLEHTTVDQHVDQLFEQIKEFTKRPGGTLFAFEDYAFGKAGQGKYFGRAELVGVLTYLIRSMGCDVVAINISTVKYYFSEGKKIAKGESKAVVQQGVFDYTGEYVSNENQSDAAGVALLAHDRFINMNRQIAFRARCQMQIVR